MVLQWELDISVVRGACNMGTSTAKDVLFPLMKITFAFSWEGCSLEAGRGVCFLGLEGALS